MLIYSDICSYILLLVVVKSYILLCVGLCCELLYNLGCFRVLYSVDVFCCIVLRIVICYCMLLYFIVCVCTLQCIMMYCWNV